MHYHNEQQINISAIIKKICTSLNGTPIISHPFFPLQDTIACQQIQKHLEELMFHYQKTNLCEIQPLFQNVIFRYIRAFISNYMASAVSKPPCIHIHLDISTSKFHFEAF